MPTVWDAAAIRRADPRGLPPAGYNTWAEAEQSNRIPATVPTSTDAQYRCAVDPVCARQLVAAAGKLNETRRRWAGGKYKAPTSPTVLSSTEAENMTTRLPSGAFVGAPVEGGGQGSILGGIVGGVTGFLTGGPGGAVVGAATGYMSGGGSPQTPPPAMPAYTLPPPSSFTGTGAPSWGQSITGGDCPPGTRKEFGIGPGGGWLTQCIPLGGSDPIIGPPQVGGGTAVAPLSSGAVLPGHKSTAVCPKDSMGRRFVLGKDGLCYPPGVLKNKDRLYPKARKPHVTAADYRAISRADRARKKLVKLTKKAGAHASMTKPRSRRAAPRGHHEHLHHN